MKLFTILTTLVVVANVEAVTIQVNNNNLADTNLVVDNAGSLLSASNGAVAVGHFGNLDNAEVSALGGTTVTTLFDSFNQIGTPVSFSDSTPGFFTGSIDADLGGADSSAVGKGVFLVVGNNQTDIRQSTEILVFRYEYNFSGEPSEGPTAATLINGRGTLLIGGYGNWGFDNDSNAGTPDIPAFNLVSIPVPEPSSVALLGLGSVALLLRRRK